MQSAELKRERGRPLAEDAFVYTPRWPGQEWQEGEAFYLPHRQNPHRFGKRARAFAVLVQHRHLSLSVVKSRP